MKDSKISWTGLEPSDRHEPARFMGVGMATEAQPGAVCDIECEVGVRGKWLGAEGGGA